MSEPHLFSPPPLTVNKRGQASPSPADIDTEFAGVKVRREVIGEWYGCKLSSVFEPILDPLSGQARGPEAFLRC